MDAQHRQNIIDIYKKLVLDDVGGGGVCEKCGKTLPHMTDMINTNNISYVFLGQVGSPGHAALPYLQCPVATNSQHWACSPECWLELAKDCIENHQYPILVHFRDTLKGENNANNG
jgi:hypothetical protein